MIVVTKVHIFYFTLFLTPSSKNVIESTVNNFKTLFFKFLYMFPHKLFYPTVQSLLKLKNFITKNCSDSAVSYKIPRCPGYSGV